MYYRTYWEAKYSKSTLRSTESAPHFLTTTQEAPTTFWGLPSRSKVQRPAHSPSFLASDTLIKGILSSPSLHKASTNLMMDSSVTLSQSTHIWASLRERALEASRKPRARPSWTRAVRRTPLRASSMEMVPEVSSTTTSSTICWSSTSDMFVWTSSPC